MADTVKFIVKAEDQATGTLKSVDKGVAKNADSFKKAGAAITAFGVASALAFNKFLGLASDSEEVGSKFNVVFADMREDADKWATSFAKSAGRSTTQIKKMSSEFGDLLKPMGFTTEEALGLSQQLVEITGDLSSFNNVSEQVAFEKLRAGLIGSSEPLLAFGIDVRESRVQLEAQNKGISDNVKEMTAQEKILARISTIYSMSTDAQGDLMRTQDSYANSVKRLQAAQIELGESIGTIILPFATKMVGVLTDLANWFDNLSPGIKKTIVIFAAITTALALVIGPMLLIIGFIPAIIAGFAAISAPVMITVAAIMALVAAGAFLIANWDWVKQKSTEVWDSMPDVLQNAISFMLMPITALIAIGNAIIANWDSIKAAAMATWTIIKTFLKATFALITGDYKNFWKLMGELTQLAMDAVVAIFTAAKPLVISAFTSMFEGIGNVLKNIMNGVINTIQNTINNIVKMANGVISLINKALPGRFKITLIPELSLPKFAHGGIVGKEQDAQQFADGGAVRGPAGIDNVPAMLTAGEVVLNSAQQSNLAGKLNGGGGTNIEITINAGNVVGDLDEFADNIGEKIIKTFQQHTAFQSF